MTLRQPAGLMILKSPDLVLLPFPQHGVRIHDECHLAHIQALAAPASTRLPFTMDNPNFAERPKSNLARPESSLRLLIGFVDLILTDVSVYYLLGTITQFPLHRSNSVAQPIDLGIVLALFEARKLTP
jgi:hypothetical protein